MNHPKPDPQSIEDFFGPVLHAYSRAEALEDGALVEVTSMATEAGFRIPVALTRSVWESYVTVPAKVRAQDERGRLWDILWMASLAARSSRDAQTVHFTVAVRNDNRSPRPRRLKAVVDGGDDGFAVITILLPDED